MGIDILDLDVVNESTENLRAMYMEIVDELKARKDQEKYTSFEQKWGKRNLHIYQSLVKLFRSKENGHEFVFGWIEGLEVSVMRDSKHISRTRAKIPPVTLGKIEKLEKRIVKFDDRFEAHCKRNNLDVHDGYSALMDFGGCYDDLMDAWYKEEDKR